VHTQELCTQKVRVAGDESCNMNQKAEVCKLKKKVTYFTIKQQVYRQQTGKQACRLPYSNTVE